MLTGHRWVRAALGAFAGISVVAMALPAPSSAVINGDPTDVGAFPFLVAIGDRSYDGQGDMYGGRYNQFCGGTLVAPSKVVTAAHCVAERDVEPSDLVVGSMGGGSLKSKQSQISVVKRIVVHPAYDSRLIINDIAVLTLEAPLVGVPRATPAIDDAALVAGGSQVYSAGWGSTDQSIGEAGFPDLFRVAPLTVFPDASCGGGESYIVNGHRFNGWGVNDSVYADRQLCAQNFRDAKVVDTCVGDSGGPLIAGTGADLRLIGIVSWGPSECATRDPGVYTRIAHYRYFLQKQGVPFAPPSTATPDAPVLVGAAVSARTLTVRMRASADGARPEAFWAEARDSAGHIATCAVYAPIDGSPAACEIAGLTNGVRYAVTSYSIINMNRSTSTAVQHFTPAGRPAAPSITTVVVGTGKAAFTVTRFVANGSRITAKYVKCVARDLPTLHAPVLDSGRATVSGMVADARYTCKAYAANARGVSDASVPAKFVAN